MRPVKLLLPFSHSRYSREQVDYALRRAGETRGEILACLVLDTRLTGLITDEVSDIGFLGERPSDEFRGAVLREHERQGRSELSRIGELARSRGLQFSERVETGDFVEVCLQIAAQEEADEIVVARAVRSRVGRLVFGSAVNEIVRRAVCPVTVFGQDDGHS